MMYVWIGILLFIVGLILVTFIPFSKLVERLGSLFMVIGVILAVLFPLIKDLWENSQTFQIIIYSIFVIIIIGLIMFSGKEEKK